MGRHLVVDDSKNGWLATLGCCASRTYNHEDDDEIELQAGKSLEAGALTFNQPQPIEPPRLTREYTRPLTSYSMGQTISSWVETGRDMASKASSRASTMRVRTWTGQSSRHRPTISISAPTDFRRLDERDAMPPPPVARRRRSFRPLELSIYLPDNRLSPLPDFNASDWDRKPRELECPAPALLRSRTPSVSATTASMFTIQRKPVGSSIDDGFSSASHSRSTSRLSMGASSVDVGRQPSFPWVDPLSSHPPTPPAHQTTTPSLNRSNTQYSLPAPPRPISRTGSPSPPPSFRSRAMTEPSRGRATPSPTPPSNPINHQKRPSIRRPNLSVDDAIRELNTIVEERRAAEYRTSANSLSSNAVPRSPSHHVPAIAPNLRMHVRSETLSDIGSAFSVPLNSKPLPSAPQTPFTPAALGEKRPLMLAKPVMTASPVQEVDESAATRGESGDFSRPSTSTSLLTSASTKSKLSLWLRRQHKKGSLSNDSIDFNTWGQRPSASHPFYQCVDPSTPGTPTPRAAAPQHAHHSSISSVSTYETTPSLSGRTETTITSAMSLGTPFEGKEKMWKAKEHNASLSTGCLSDVKQLEAGMAMGIPSPLTPSKVGLAF